MTRPYIAPANASSTAENWPTPSVLPRKYQRQYSITSAPTPVTISAITHERVSSRADSSMPSGGIQSNASNGISPDSTAGVWIAVYVKAATGSRAAR